MITAPINRTWPPVAVYATFCLVISLLFATVSGCDSQEVDPFLNGSYEAVAFTATTADGKTVDLLTADSTIRFVFASRTNRVDGSLSFPMATPAVSSRLAAATDSVADIRLTGRFAQDNERIRFHDLKVQGLDVDDLRRLFVYGDWHYDAGTVRGTSASFSITLKPRD